LRTDKSFKMLSEKRIGVDVPGASQRVAAGVAPLPTTSLAPVPQASRSSASGSETLEDVRHELIVKRLAVDEGGQGLAVVGAALFETGDAAPPGFTQAGW
jgi:hypothetical protein